MSSDAAPGGPSSAARAADELRHLLGAPDPLDAPADTPTGPPLPAPEGHTTGRAVWRCEHCGGEQEAWVRPQCPTCYTMSTQAIRWVGR
ncbi:MAG TPA: hypothetical protein VNT56_06680 [Acidimicrobiales bacterium]|nr:hypothetical protein [Acidimicrobiales bacterium]